MPTLKDRMDKLFKRLDTIPLAPASIFSADAQKQHYESELMYAFRKLQGAQYHRRRVDEIHASEQANADKVMTAPETRPEVKIAEIKMTMSQANHDYAHELAAFCAAIRSGMDFLTRVMVLHTKAIKQVDSIKSFLTFVAEGRKGPTIDVVAKHAKWLAHIRDYRDYLIHRLVLNTVSGQQRVLKKGAWANTAYPVTVPSETPKNVPDTRVARMLDEPEQHFEYRTSEAWVAHADGSTRVLEHSVDIRPGPGEMRIEDMMDRELKSFEAFFGDVIEVLLTLDFQPAPVPHPPKQAASNADT